MPYDISKITSLGQMKSALQRVKTEIGDLKSVRTTYTIAVADWTASGNDWVKSNLVPTTAYHHYDVFLDPATTPADVAMVANANITVASANNYLSFTCTGTKPDAAINIVVVETPIASNVTSYYCDLGNGGKANQSEVDTLSSSVNTLNTNIPKLLLCASNVSVAVNKWTSSGDSTYPYKAELLITDVTDSHFPIVQFSDSDSATYDFSPTVSTSAGKLTIYCKTTPADAITITSIFCIKGTTVTVS